MKFLFLFFIFFEAKAQFIELQFIGEFISEENATGKVLCETKYCLSDANYLGLAATQDKSVRPCDDFKEFTLGTFLKYQSVNERNRYAGFSIEIVFEITDRLRKSLEAPVNEADTQVTKEMKKMFAQCVDSKYVEENGLKDVLEHAQSLGLDFHPKLNSENFNLTSYILKEPDSTLLALFQTRFYINEEADEKDNTNTLFILQAYEWDDTETRLRSYVDMLYDMKHVYFNSSYSDKFREEFREIAEKQVNFYKGLAR